MTRSFLLTGPDAARALEAGGPLVDLQIDPAKLADMTIAVVEVDGRIVAYWVVWTALHLEPLWIAPEHRKSPPVVSGLVGALQQAVEATGETVAYCEIADENLPVIGPMASKLGFHEAPGKLYYLLVQQPAAEGVL